MLLDLPPQLRQCQDLTVREGSPVFAGIEFDPLGATARAGHDGDTLVSQAALDYLSGRSVRDEVVWVDHPRDDSLAEAWAGVYDSLTALPRDRVRSKQYAGDRRVDHPLHGDGEAHAVWVDPVRSPVADGAVRPQRDPAAPHRVEYRFDADHVQIRVLLSCEARLWQVLSRSRGTDGHRNRCAVSQTLVCLRDGLSDKVGNDCIREVRSRLLGEPSQTRRVLGLRPGQRGKRGPQPRICRHQIVCRRGNTESGWHRKSSPGQLAEVRRLAAGLCQRVPVYRGEG